MASPGQTAHSAKHYHSGTFDSVYAEGRDKVWRQVVAGALSGMMTKTSVAPIERMKVIVQTEGMRTQGKRSVRQIFSAVYAQGGFLGLYKGNGANCLRVVPVYALKFSLNDQIKERVALARAAEGAGAGSRAVAGGKYELTVLEKIAAGCAAGVAQITLTYPLDLVRTRLQLAEAAGTSYSGIAHCLRDTVAREGTAALYKGLVPSMMAGVPYVGLQMTFYAELKNLMQGAEDKVGWAGMLFCGSLAGLSAQTICYPLDTVRHRMQANGIQGQAKVYSGTWDCIAKVARNEGFRGFFKGWGLNTLRALPGAAVQFTSYDLLKRLLGLEA